MERTAKPKPITGEYVLQRRAAQQQHKSREAKTMRDVRRRDGDKCRVPQCEYAKRNLPIDVCHTRHRGMGGNPKEDRTVPELLFCACRIHHGLYDRGELDVEPLTTSGMDGPVAFSRRSESGRLECIGVERRIGVSETRGA